MALFSGSPGGHRRPLGPRPFSGRESSALAPVLRPHGDPRRATAAPFLAIPDVLSPVGSVSLATPGEVPVTDAIDARPAAELAKLLEAPQPAPVMAPSVLRVDDIRSEPLGWDSGFSELEPEPAHEALAALSVPDELAEAVIESTVAAPEALPAIDAVVADLMNVDAPELEAPEGEALVSDDSPVGDWFANEVMQVGSDLEASPWADDDAAFADVPVHSAWSDQAEAVEAPPPETEAIDATAAREPDVGAIEDTIVAEVHDAAAITPVVEVAEGETVPDESWWPARDEAVAHVAPEPEVAVTPAPRLTPPVDGLAALDALVHETQGAERAVEALEAVARMIRSREIVVSVGAGATAESVLASILASLLSHPS